MQHISMFAAALALAACGGTATTETEAPTPRQPAGAHNTPTEPSDSVGVTPDDIQNPAPEFALADLDGNTIELASYRGKTVVLEWFNPGCPFVKYAHNDGPLTDMARQTTKSGIVWLKINSGSPGNQGNAIELNRKAAQNWGITTPVLIDETGKVGKKYGAKTTPHMFIVNEVGSIVYKGALDNAPLGRAPADGKINYVEAALADLAAGRQVQTAETQSYGCSVKYRE